MLFLALLLLVIAVVLGFVVHPLFWLLLIVGGVLLVKALR